MSNFNRNISKDYELQKNEMLFNMQNEIESLEKECKNINFTNLKRSLLMNFKMVLTLLRAAAPYLLTAGLVFGGFKMVGATPFYRDLVKEDLDVKKTYDSFGNKCIEQQYEDYKDSNNYLYYYPSWKEDKDGLYSRKVEVYRLNYVSEEKI